jgi:hypothetical protein
MDFFLCRKMQISDVRVEMSKKTRFNFVLISYRSGAHQVKLPPIITTLLVRMFRLVQKATSMEHLCDAPRCNCLLIVSYNCESFTIYIQVVISCMNSLKPLYICLPIND